MYLTKKFSLLLLSLLVLSTASFKITKNQKSSSTHDKLVQTTDSNNLRGQIIAPGHGYCSDTQQVSPVKCFEVTVLPISHASSIVNFDSGMSFDQIQKQFKIDVKSKVRIWMWGGGFSAAYFRSIEDTDFSMSIHYYAMIEGDVGLEIGYGQSSALTKDGINAYQSGKNPNFNLICGDQAVTEYKTGASLTLSMEIEFKSSAAKNAFSAAIGVSYGPFFKLSSSVQVIAQSLHIAGKVVIHGFQEGGNPSELGKILNQKCGDHYCAAACDITNMAACTSAVDGLIRYASENFPEQVNFQENRGLSPYPVGFASLTSIKFLGLVPAKTYVSDEVIAARIKLGQALTENQYYYNKVNAILNNYPGAFDKFSHVYQKLDSLKNRVTENMRLLMDDQDGAIGCYSDPQNCPMIAKELLAELGPIDTSDWSWMDQLKRKLNVLGSWFYRTGDGPGNLVMVHGYNPDAANIVSLFTISWGPADLYFKVEYDTGNAFGHKHVIYTVIGTLKSSDQCNYTGHVDNDYGTGHETDPIGCPCDMSQFYFTPYQKVSDEELRDIDSHQEVKELLKKKESIKIGTKK